MNDSGEKMSMVAQNDPVELATELTIAWLSNPNTRVSSEDVPVFLQRMHEAVSALEASGSVTETGDATEAPQAYAPAVSVRKSLARSDAIISMIDGKPYKTLRRHLKGHGLTPEQYRERYGLKADYPMVAPDYSEARRDMAKKIGLGRKPRQAEAEAVGTAEVSDGGPEGSAERPRRGRKLGIAAAKAHLGS